MSKKRQDEILGARQEHEDRERARRRLAKLRGKPIKKGNKRQLKGNDRRWIDR